MFPSKLPILKSNVAPLPFSAISEAVKAVKETPTMSFVLFPISKPRSTLLVLSVMVFPELVRFGLVPLVFGKVLE